MNLYDRIYCRRGDVENRIKELKEAMGLGRTSCSRFWANQFRVLMVVAAYALIQEVRGAAKGTKFARAQAWQIRELLFKLGAWMRKTVRRLVVHAPRDYAYLKEWRQIARALQVPAT